VVVLTDLGSAVMTAESAIEFASDPEAILLADAPLVEGLVAAAVAAQGGAGVEEVRKAAEAVGFAASAAVGASTSPSESREPDATGDFELINPMGIHARPAAKIAGGLSGLDAEVTINDVDGTSMMALMTLAAGQGATLRVQARGKDAAKAVQYVGRLVGEGFGEL
jgi:PTS hybrid protein